ncbi:transcription factor IIA subunit alpha [Polyrhizophydium stewartii]|uniref:Transcription factor IIA subunit alpha n=1 Tax=Polyrhizophydium stewartii TaxID=2732419 RepID=A0ABR4NB16_9FUNG
MSNQAVPPVYKWVMSDVIQKMSQRFAELGMDVNVLSELEQTWEAKIVAMNVAPFTPPASVFQPAQPHFDSVQTIGQYGIAATAPIKREAGIYDFTSGPASLAGLANPQAGYQLPQHDGPADDDASGEAVASEHVVRGAAPIPAVDGSADAPLVSEPASTHAAHLTRQQIDQTLLAQAARKAARQAARPARKGAPARRVAQLDGNEDEEEEEEEGDDENSDIGGSELDDDESGDEANEAKHLALCQFEKVQRIKNKWKCVLKDGVINVNDKDYLFNKANCDFEW